MRWTLKPKQDDEQIKALAEILKVDRLIAQLLLQRGVTSYEEAKKFFRPQLSDLHDPFLMKDMELAVIRIENAILANENILIYGDYDVDGISGTALLYKFLYGTVPRVFRYLPERRREGYGVSSRAVDWAIETAEVVEAIGRRVV